jgi:predicted MPP superfamily phosphohydrolase
MSLRQLPPHELIGAIAVVGGVGYVYLHSTLLYIWKFSSKDRTRLRWWEKFILLSAVVITMCSCYAFFVEPYWLEVTHTTIYSDKIPPGARKVRIVLLSDTHCDALKRLEPLIPNVVAQEHPDLIVFAGDAINELGGVPVLHELLSSLALIAPTYVVEGNHDVRDFPRVNIVDKTGAKLLRCGAADIDVRGAHLHLIGSSIDYEAGLDKLFKQLKPSNLNVYAYHFPAGILEAEKYPVDVMLTGHTHGGQVCLPFYGAIITHSATSKRFESGLYKVGGTWLYVNRGLGMDGGLSPRIRFFARPEVTVIDIMPGAGANK